MSNAPIQINNLASNSKHVQPRRGPGKPPGEIVLGVLAALADGAQLTRSEVCRELGRERMAVASVMSRMNKPTAWKPKRIYVVGYVFEDDEGRRYPRALYALGALPDAKKPKVVAGAVQARYRQRNKGQVASVWDLGKVGLGRRQQFKESFR